VRVLRNVRVRPGLYEREVVLEVGAQRIACCVASSVITVLSREAYALVDSGAVGIAQLFETLGELPKFALVEVAKNDPAEGTFRRIYTLSSAHVVCQIEEIMPADLFDDDFLLPRRRRSSPLETSSQETTGTSSLLESGLLRPRSRSRSRPTGAAAAAAAAASETTATSSPSSPPPATASGDDDDGGTAADAGTSREVLLRGGATSRR